MDRIDLIKTTKAYQNLADDFHKQKLPHCNLLVSPDLMSRELFAIAFATLVVCDDKNTITMQNIAKKIHPDVFFLPRSGNLKVEDVEIVLDRINYFPMEADVKAFVLENFSAATTQAQNKLLKTLEETPQNVYFLICSEKDDGILPTIKSRCRRLELEPLSESALNILMADYNTDQKTIEIANFFGRGEMGRTDYALTNKAVSELVDLGFDILKNCKSSANLLQFAVKLLKYKDKLALFLQIYSDILEKVLRLQILNEKTDFTELNFETLKNELSTDAILTLLDRLSRLTEMLERACHSTLIIDDLLIETCKCANMKS